MQHPCCRRPRTEHPKPPVFAAVSTKVTALGFAYYIHCRIGPAPTTHVKHQIAVQGLDLGPENRSTASVFQSARRTEHPGTEACPRAT